MGQNAGTGRVMQGGRLASAAALAVAIGAATPEWAQSCTLTTSGPAFTDAGAVFTLTLSAADTGDGLPTSWTINWGDGTIDTLAGNPGSATHTYTAPYASRFTYDILASATCGGRTYFQNDLVVPGLQTDALHWYAHDAATGVAVTRAPVQSGPDAGLNSAHEAIIGPDGNVYVSGLTSGNVVRYDTAGAFVDEFATGGTQASGMKFGPDGNLYVGDASLATVRRYDGITGAYIDDFVTAGLGGVVEPEGLTFGPDGNLYVSDFTNDTVYRYDGATGAFIDVFITGPAPRDPEDLMFGPDGHLYVASDRDDHVRRYDGTTGAYIDDFVAANAGGLDNAQGVGFGPDGQFYVSSWNDDAVYRYDGSTGAFVDVYVSTGLGGVDQAEYFNFLPGHQVTVDTPSSGHHLIYQTNDSSPDTPRVRTLTTVFPTWDPEATTAAASTNVNWIVSAQGTTRDEEIAVVFSDAPQIDVQRWNGTAWSAEWSSTAGLVATNATRRGTAVAYEQTSGDAMVVYTNNSANPQFRVWNGTMWTAAADVFTVAPGGGEVRWIELASDPTTDRVALAYSDGLHSYAALWNGATWDQATIQQLTPPAGAPAFDYRDIDLAYEASGELVVVNLQAGANRGGFHYWTMAAGTTIWVDGGDVAQVGGSLAYVELAAEPGADRMAVVTIDENAGTERLGASTWNGGAWVDAGEYVTTVPHWETDGPGTFWAAVAWVGTAGQAVIAFSDDTAGELGWLTWAAGPGWVLQADVSVPGMAGNIRSLQLVPLAGMSRIVAAFSDDAGDLRTAGYAAGNWSIGGALNGDLTSSDYKPFALSAPVSFVATAVELLALEASGVDGAVELRWETATEIDNLGFHVYRGDSASGPWERVTASLIPGLGSSAEGALYGYRDPGLQNGREYFYLIEDVEGTGRTERHGPVAATPAAEAAGDPGTDPDPDAEPDPEVDLEPGEVPGAWLAYGHPEANALRVVSRGRSGVRLELETHGFYALAREDGTVRLWVPGFEDLEEPGAPRIPVRRTWLEAVAGRDVKLRGVRIRDVESFSGLRPAEAGEPVLVTLGDGTHRLAERRARRLDRRLAKRAKRLLRSAERTGSLSPELPARVLEVGFLGEEKRAWIELAPLRWDAVSGQLLLARRIQLDVAFAGRVEGEVSLGGSRGRRARKGRRDRGREEMVVARLVTREAGLHSVAFEDVFPDRGRRVRASRLGLSRLGEPVAYHLEPSARRFGPGSRIYFLSVGGEAATHGNEAVYELTLGGKGLAMETARARPRGGAVPYGFATRRFEQQRRYLSGLTEAPAEDLWFWDIAIAPGVKSFDFALDAVSAQAPARLRVELQGAADVQHARVRVNGQPVGELEWTGREGREIEAELPPGWLVEGTNRLEVEAVTVPEGPSAVWLDAFTVEYPRRLEAVAGRLDARFDASGTATLTGVDAGSRLVDTTGPVPVWLEGAHWTPGGLSWAVSAGQRVSVTSPGSVLAPQVRPAEPPALRRSEGADYVAIGPRAFLEAAAALLQHRRDQGLRVAAVAIEDVYDEFGHGEPGPEAVRAFLSWAYHEWPQPQPRYVLLLGDTTYDPKDYLGAPARDHVPAWIARASTLWTLSDSAYGAVNGDDLLPDVAVGRLPAADVEQARVLAEKVVAFERDGWGFDDGRVVLVADDPDHGGDFEADVAAIERGLIGRDVHTLRVRELGAATRASIRTAFDEGASLMSYLGHGAIALWASENVWNSNDPQTLAPQPRQPLVLAMNCLNGYVVHPYTDALGEALLKPEGKGSIATFTASALSLNSVARIVHDALLHEVLEGSHSRLGDALLEAQRAFADVGGSPETLGTYLLLGDPALVLR